MIESLKITLNKQKKVNININRLLHGGFNLVEKYGSNWIKFP